jgi:hypothetical protein
LVRGVVISDENTAPLFFISKTVTKNSLQSSTVLGTTISLPFGYRLGQLDAAYAGCEAANSRTNSAINFFIVTPNNREWKLYYLAE